VSNNSDPQATVQQIHGQNGKISRYAAQYNVGDPGSYAGVLSQGYAQSADVSQPIGDVTYSEEAQEYIDGTYGSLGAENFPIEQDQLRADIFSRWDAESFDKGATKLRDMINNSPDFAGEIDTWASGMATKYDFHKAGASTILAGAYVEAETIYDKFYIFRDKVALEGGWTRQDLMGIKNENVTPETIELVGQLTQNSLEAGNTEEMLLLHRNHCVSLGDWMWWISGKESVKTSGEMGGFDIAVEALFMDGILADAAASSPIGDLGNRPAVQTNVTFQDHYFEMTIPFSKRENELLGDVQNTAFYDVQPSYNFLHQQYETLASLGGVAEIYLPNMYLYLTSQYAEEHEAGIDLLTTLGGSFTTNAPDGGSGGFNLLSTLESAFNEQSLKLKMNYFTQYTDFIMGVKDNDLIIQQSQKSANLGFSNSNVKYLLDYNDSEVFFPMTVDFQMSTQTDTSFTETINDFEFDYGLLKTIMEGNVLRDAETGALRNFSLYPLVKRGQYVSTSLNGSTSDVTSPEIVSYQAERMGQILDLDTWVNEFQANGDEDMAVLLATSFYRFIGDTKQASYVSNNFFNTLFCLMFKTRLAQVKNEKARTIEEVFEGKPAHSEILFYKVSKHLVTSDGSVDPVPVQNFYFTNSNELKELRYIDTQVSYDKTYRYIVSAYVMVIGTAYKYKVRQLHIGGGALGSGEEVYADDPKGIAQYDPGSKDFRMVCSVEHKPTAKLIEVPYLGLEPDEFDTVVYMWDDPPVAPEVMFIPIKNMTNKIRIFMNGATGRLFTDPIVVNEADVQNLPKIRAYQKLPPSYGTKVKYESDDPISRFEIFRIDPDIDGNPQKPFSYSDFSSVQPLIVETPTANSCAIIDVLEPNKKYYYMVRGVDYHGNVSLPSPLYEVELVMEPQASISYPIIKVVDFAKEVSYTMKKSMRRYFHISPKIVHTLLKSEIMDNPNFFDSAKLISPALGIVDDPLFINKEQSEDSKLRKFKIRMTSKQTGKKIDFNIKFVHEHEKLHEEL
jgi:hypothetical protein